MKHDCKTYMGRQERQIGMIAYYTCQPTKVLFIDYVLH
jgi:hypothetical protein